MSLIEIVDKLCHVTTVLSDLVQEQSNIMVQSGVILMDNGSGENAISRLQEQADTELDEIEMALRKET